MHIHSIELENILQENFEDSFNLIPTLKIAGVVWHRLRHIFFYPLSPFEWSNISKFHFLVESNLPSSWKVVEYQLKNAAQKVESSLEKKKKICFLGNANLNLHLPAQSLLLHEKTWVEMSHMI